MVETRTRLTGRAILGLIIMVLGALWTLDNLDLFESERILQWWPAVLVAIGLAKLLGVGTARHLAAGAIFLFVGSWLLADALGLVHVSLFDLWPVALVLLGLSLLSRSLGRQQDGAPVEDPSAQFSTFAFWSGVQRKVLSQQFRGGEVTAVMGGAEINLRGAKPVEGGAVIDVFTWWGGVELFVPEHWRVINEATALMGGIEDKAKTPPADARDTLIIRGLVVMGGVEIKN